MSTRYCLVSDGDGHTWLCPAERRSEALECIEAVEQGDDSAPDPDSLPWLRRIDNPGRLTFTEPREEP